MSAKRKVPWFWRRQTSCPDCGHVYHGEAEVDAATTRHAAKKDSDGIPFPVSITCPRCKAHYGWDEWWEIQHDKYSLKSTEEE